MDLPDLPDWLPIAVDTETNGLWADSGARVSVISLGWVEPAIVAGPPDGLIHAIRTGEGVHDLALPFAQGPWGKGGVEDLFLDSTPNPNLGLEEWLGLLAWLNPKRHVYHNGKFDVEKLRYGPIGWEHDRGLDFVNNWFWDTQVSAAEIWPGETSGLKPTAARLWGVNSTAEAEALKPYLGPKDNPRYDLVPWEVMEPYAAKDTNLTIRLYYHQMLTLGLIDRDGVEYSKVNETLLRHCKREIAVAKNLYRTERAGIPFDAAVSQEAAKTLKKRQAELEKILPFGPTANAAKKYFFTDGRVVSPTGLHKGLGLLPYSRTAGGQAQLTEEVVQRLIVDYTDEHPAGKAARIWQERNKLANAVSKWYGPYAVGIGSDGRLRTCFRQVTKGRGTEDGGTRSGRFSVERVNLQAIPHDYRMVAGQDRDWKVPTPRQLIGSAAAKLVGWELWEFDLAQAELRLAAAWANCERMLSALREGRDLHGETARELFHVKPEDSDWALYRQIGKRSNFTLCFGAGGETLAKMVQRETGMPMTTAQGEKIVTDWNRLYPEFRRTIDSWSKVADFQREVPLASAAGFGTGRKRRFAPGEETHKAFNQLVQGSLGEFAKDWNLLTEQTCWHYGLGTLVEGIGYTGLCLVIHDSQVVLLPAGKYGEVVSKKVTEGARLLWDRYFNTPDPKDRVSTIEGYAEGKRW